MILRLERHLDRLGAVSKYCYADDLTTTTTVSTIPSSTVIATDQVAGGQHYQRIKLADGTADSTSMVSALTTLPASNAVGLTVRPLAMTDGTNSMPTGDAAARKIYVTLADALNYSDSICQVSGVQFDSAGNSLAIKNIGVDSTGFTFSANGDNTVITADATHRIRLLWVSVQWASATAVNAKFLDGTGGTQISALFEFNSTSPGVQGVVLDPPAGGYVCQTSVNKALVLNLSAAQAVNVMGQYLLV